MTQTQYAGDSEKDVEASCEKSLLRNHTENSFSWRTTIIFVGFILVGSIHEITQHSARNLEYNFLLPVICISILKIWVSLLLFVFEDGDNLFKVIPQLCHERQVLLMYSVPSGMYAAFDALSFVSLSFVDPATYIVLLQLKIVSTGWIRELMFQKKMNSQEHLALWFITIACVLKQVHSIQVIRLHYYSVAFIAVQIVVNCGASVSNEFLLKKNTVSINLQNIVSYSWSILWCLATGGIGQLLSINRLSLNPLDMQEWLKMIDLRMWPSIIILTLNGLLTARVLKYMDVNWKSIGNAVQAVLCTYVSALVWNEYTVTIFDLASLLLLVAGVYLFNTAQSVTYPNKP